MIAARGQLRGLAWAALALVALSLLFALSLHVNALKSKVRGAELQIVALKHEKLYLETEFETRSNQQQLETWNDVDFGYLSPGPGQFVHDERKLAAIGKVSQPSSPSPPAAAAAGAAAAPVRLARAPATRRDGSDDAAKAAKPAKSEPQRSAAATRTEPAKAEEAAKREGKRAHAGKDAEKADKDPAKKPGKELAKKTGKEPADKQAVKLAAKSKPAEPAKQPRPSTRAPRAAASQAPERERRVAALDLKRSAKAAEGTGKSKEERGP